MIEEIITAKLEHGSKNEKSLLETMQTGIDFEISIEYYEDLLVENYFGLVKW